jgi:hypothetical protein
MVKMLYIQEKKLNVINGAIECKDEFENNYLLQKL